MERKLNLAIIGQGRSGKDIHGNYYRSERNSFYNVKYVVDKDEARRVQAIDLYPGCTPLSDYKELFNFKDIDLVVNASYSEMHYAITKDLLEHGFNVLSEKPLAANGYECRVLIETAKKNGVLLATFQNTQLAPFYLHAKRLIEDKTLGDVKQVSIRYNGFSRRWDWQTLQKKLAGNAYNTGPHPIAMALGFLDFDDNTRVIYSKLDTALTSGDAEDYVKILLGAPNKPLVDIEMNSTDGFSDYILLVQGSKGCFKCTIGEYKLKYIIDGENPKREVIEESLKDENGEPAYCSENFIVHMDEGKYDGTAFDIGTAAIYESVYRSLTEGKPLLVTPEQSTKVIEVIERAHAENPLPVKFL
ncbi:MAG: Gfo/Idh/MocA family oxidoreductase [Clostridia bacterium]|nr:Gfo/Idh/MocA family oxidoreductase [Clostridia bacterium]